MKRYYIFNVHETYAGSRDGEITVVFDSDEKSFNISKRGQDEEAEDIAYEMYVDNDVEWEDRRGYDDDETDYQIDLDREEDDRGVEDDL